MDEPGKTARSPVLALALALAGTLTLYGCATSAAPPASLAAHAAEPTWPAAGPEPTAPPSPAAPSGSVGRSGPAAPSGQVGRSGQVGAPARRYTVGRRSLALARGAARPLPTVVWYPAGDPPLFEAPLSSPQPTRQRTAGPAAPGRRPPVPPWLVRHLRPAAEAPNPAAAGAPVRPGRYPLVLVSHGLHGRPESFAALGTTLAAAGFVVAAPAYPHTHRRTSRYRRADIVHQPADARHVIAELGRRSRTPGHWLAGHVDTGRVAAVGHSAGGYTTAGMFAAGHSPVLRSGVVLAGWAGRTPFGGPQGRLLFVHGTADAVVPLSAGRAGYDRVPWPKAFLTLPGVGHAGYLRPGGPAYPPVVAVVTDFLRWTLQDDLAARGRLVAGPVTRADPSGPAALQTGPRW